MDSQTPASAIHTAGHRDPWAGGDGAGRGGRADHQQRADGRDGHGRRERHHDQELQQAKPGPGMRVKPTGPVPRNLAQNSSERSARRPGRGEAAPFVPGICDASRS